MAYLTPCPEAGLWGVLAQRHKDESAPKTRKWLDREHAWNLSASGEKANVKNLISKGVRDHLVFTEVTP